MPYRFEREARTPYSESYTIESDTGDEIGRIDIHLTPSGAYGTLCVADGTEEEDIQDLIDEIDEQLVLSADRDRADFLVTVWAGKNAGTYSVDDDLDDEDDDDFDDESEDGLAR